ncbi:hypothetical protein Q5P01_019598 [Channa striata]|uniref:X-ray radiation resistance-associated protein 1 n=1 Tax=Channa striata TaxID=64152 RepID=A0AA88M1J8_CHASR|nr:hypothetical protein Q5P01_019598 [Channa striata]
MTATFDDDSFDDGHRFPTKCFPARTLLRQRREGAGHWIVAYRNTTEQNYRNLHRRIKETRKNSREAAAGNTLDAPFLLRLHPVDGPSELCSVDITEQNLNFVKPEELKVFYNVAYIDASINFLSLGSFSSFESLRELDLSVNRICNMAFDAADFPHLEVLNLSYNNLSNEDIVSIGQLPRLKILHLTGNKLHRLLPELPAKEDTLFSALEVLMLDDNKLSSGVFDSLTNFKRIKYLNLQGNCISEVPYLQLIGDSNPDQTSVKEQAKQEAPAFTASSKKNCDSVIFYCLSRLWIIHKDKCNGYSVFRSDLPLPELQFLNLADNKIAEEEALMGLALFPKLCEIDISSNPLTTQRKGDPPLLTYYLQETLGIIIKRKKAQDIVKLSLNVSTDPKWKVDHRIPHVSKKLLMDGPRPTQIQVEKDNMTFKRAGEFEDKIKESTTIQENAKHFFFTQTDNFEHEFDLQTDDKETAANKEGDEEEGVPENFNCYKMLMSAKPNPVVAEPIGIQTAVRMLEHTLKNLNVYQDSKPKLDNIQAQYRQKKKRIKALPPLKPVKQPNKRVDEIIKQIKETTAKREVFLSSILPGKGANEQDYKEAMLLLGHMKTKYKMIHKSSMEQVGSMEFDRNASIGGAEPPLCGCSKSAKL